MIRGHSNESMTTTAQKTPDADQDRALDLLREAHSFVLVGHQRPDGDCLGGQTALARGLRSLGKEVRILNPDPPGRTFGYLAETTLFEVYQGGELPAHDVVCLLDFNEPSRCGPELQEAVRRAPSRKLVIDHHPPLTGPWWDEAFLDPRASATGLLVYRILLALGAKIDRETARGIFTSIVTDTGWFRYSNTDTETLEVASELLRCGVNPTEVYGAIYQRMPATEPRALGAMLQRVEYYCDGRLAVLDHPLDAGYANDLSDSDAALDILRSVEDVEVVLYLKELEGGICKLSARSKTDYDVCRLAAEFGGGGHVKASGATIRGTLADVRRRLIEAASKGFQVR